MWIKHAHIHTHADIHRTHRHTDTKMHTKRDMPMSICVWLVDTELKSKIKKEFKETIGISDANKFKMNFKRFWIGNTYSIFLRWNDTFAAGYCGCGGGFCDYATIWCAVRLGTSPFKKTETENWILFMNKFWSLSKDFLRLWVFRREILGKFGENCHFYHF